MAEEPGFVPIIVPDGRRGLWMRIGVGRRIELCAGREGDDAYVMLEAGTTLTAEKVVALADVIDTLRFAGEQNNHELSRISPRVRLVEEDRDRYQRQLGDAERILRAVGIHLRAATPESAAQTLAFVLENVPELRPLPESKPESETR